MINRLLQLLKLRDADVPKYGWSIFALDDSVNFSRRVIEEHRKQLLGLL